MGDRIPAHRIPLGANPKRSAVRTVRSQKDNSDLPDRTRKESEAMTPAPRTPKSAVHDVTPALVPQAAIEWIATRDIATIIHTLEHRHGICHHAPAPAVPPVTMPPQWRATGTYMDVTRPGRLVRVIALMAWGPDGCSVWQLDQHPDDIPETIDLDSRATVTGSIALAADPLRIPGVESITAWADDYGGMTSHVFIARELTGPEFALTVGHDLPLISAYDLMETLDRGPKYEPVTAPWKE